ncbi:unnamed protein product [Amoebophrya sp. A120]|nr:unnamed protein product [Amoebophrya sp. A120]|eukprot:GSA120T00014831001.1
MMRAVLLVTGFMVFGSLNTLSTKLQFSVSSIGLDGQLHEFKKPFFGSYRMFLAMSLVLFGYMGYKVFNTTRPLAGKSKMLTEEISTTRSFFSLPNFFEAEGVNRKLALLIAVPACCDLTSSTLSFIGLLHISASVWQMLRGSMVVFSGILSVLCLKRHLFAYNWAGIGLCVCGILMVGTANMWAATATPSGSSSQSTVEEETNQNNSRLFGMALVLFGQFISACQVVTEEFILKDCNQLPPAIVVGIEGLWGFGILTFIGFPILYNLPGADFGNSQENLLDTFAMIRNSTTLIVLTVTYLLTCSFYNFCGMSITRYLSAVHRTMLDAWRTMVVWLTGIFYFYCVDPTSDFGEPWTPYSYLQLAGFGSLILGQLIYGGLLRFPSLFSYEDGVIGSFGNPDCGEEEFTSPAATMNLLISPNSGSCSYSVNSPAVGEVGPQGALLKKSLLERENVVVAV